MRALVNAVAKVRYPTSFWTLRSATIKVVNGSNLPVRLRQDVEYMHAEL
ncbi:hypothetical protein ILFOPFJJ_05883 [Ensifer psoraleae]|nr:hypothetical protein [Sinorhizobium psoraleae]